MIRRKDEGIGCVKQLRFFLAAHPPCKLYDINQPVLGNKVFHALSIAVTTYEQLKAAGKFCLMPCNDIQKIIDAFILGQQPQKQQGEHAMRHFVELGSLNHVINGDNLRAIKSCLHPMPPVIAQCDHTITFIDCALHNLLVMSIKLLKQSTVKMENNNLPEGLCQINDYPFPPEACLAGNMYMHNLYL